MKVYLIFLILVFCFIQKDVCAQDIHGGGPHDGRYDPALGLTIWDGADGSSTVYGPHQNGSWVHWCAPGAFGDDCETVNCASVSDDARCRELLEHAADGTSPSSPGDTKPGGAKPGKKKKKKTQQESDLDALMANRPAWNGKKVYFRTIEGQWVEIKDTKAWTEKIIKSFK